MSYSFDVVLSPNPEQKVGVDTGARYGYWEFKDGREGGGLWFEPAESGALELVDFDGHYILPKSVSEALRAAGFIVDETFN